MHGLFDWKLIVTILVLGALLVLGFSLGPFADVLRSFQEKIISSEIERNVSFVVEGDAVPLTLGGSDMDVMVAPVRFVGTAKGDDINTTSPVVASQFRGTVAVDGNAAQFSGTYKKLAVRDVVFAEGPLAASSSFASLAVSNVTVDRLVLNGTLTLTVNGVETALAGKDVVLEHVKGTFFFGRAMRIAGNASSISIPSAGVQVGVPAQA